VQSMGEIAKPATIVTKMVQEIRKIMGIFKKKPEKKPEEKE